MRIDWFEFGRSFRRYFVKKSCVYRFVAAARKKDEKRLLEDLKSRNVYASQFLVFKNELQKRLEAKLSINS